MKVQIFTRSLDPVLYSLSSEFLPSHIERVQCLDFNTWQDADNYLHFILRCGEDWIINLDEDAFVTDWSVIMEMIEFMAANGYEYSGMADDGVCHHRKNSWVVCNPFFNIFNAGAIRAKMADYEDINGFQFLPWMEKHKPDFIKQVSQNDFFEPFNSIFYWLMNCSKGLYLNALDHRDELSTILLWEGKNFLYHSWYTRQFQTNKIQRTRILNLYREAKQKKASFSEVDKS